jgi:uncharacterized protein YlzI (FlbEa/FlbD family)
VITVHSLEGRPMTVDPDLIARAEPMPNTAVTTVDGNVYVIAESVRDLDILIRRHRAEHSLGAQGLRIADVAAAPTAGDRSAAGTGRPTLRIVPTS